MWLLQKPHQDGKVSRTEGVQIKNGDQILTANYCKSVQYDCSFFRFNNSFGQVQSFLIVNGAVIAEYYELTPVEAVMDKMWLCSKSQQLLRLPAKQIEEVVVGFPEDSSDRFYISLVLLPGRKLFNLEKKAISIGDESNNALVELPQNDGVTEEEAVKLAELGNSLLRATIEKAAECCKVPSTWWNVDIVNSLMLLLAQTEETAILSSFISKATRTDTVKAKLDAVIKQKMLLMLPICDNVHWSLIALRYQSSKNTYQVLHFDSVKGTHTQLVQNTLAFLSNIYLLNPHPCCAQY